MEKREFLRLIGSAAVSAPTAVLATRFLHEGSSSSPQESVYERVMRTRTIRCGYDVWPTILNKDPATGQLSGIFYDYMEAVGRNLGLHIQWIDGITYASYVTELKHGRIDAMCAGVWPIGEVIAVADFTPALYYVPIYAYVRANDTRFDRDLSILNDATFSIADIDGLVPARIARQSFPKARTLSLPQTTPASDMLLSVASGKADVTFTDSVTARKYMQANPGTLRQVPTDNPVRVFGNTIAVDKGPGDFLRMLSYATEELLNSGIVEDMLRAHETYPGSLQRVARAYRQ